MAHIEAELEFLPTERGGRRTAARSGYRPQFYYAGEDWDATHEYIGHEWVEPGQTVTVRLTVTRPEYHAGRIFVGMPFLVREGSRVVGYGRVTKILELANQPASPLPPLPAS